MKTLFYFMTFLILMSSCAKTESGTSPAESQTESGTLPAESKLVKLEYPSGRGQQGDRLTNVLGYGYDANGICDTLSVKAKVLNLSNKDALGMGYINTAGPGNFISGNSFYDLSINMNEYPNKILQPNIAFLSHLKSLLKLANNSDSIDNNCAYAYYSYNITRSSIYYYINKSSLDTELTPEFKNDLNSLSASGLVEKYGTHVLTHIYTGAKFEVLYKYNTKTDARSSAEECLYKRMDEYFGYIPGVLEHDNSANYNPANEELIFNTLGFNKKLFGEILATDNNDGGIHIGLDSLFNAGTNYQFTEIGKDGLIPLYELVTDSAKKQELKNYIEGYLNE